MTSGPMSRRERRATRPEGAGSSALASRLVERGRSRIESLTQEARMRLQEGAAPPWEAPPDDVVLEPPTPNADAAPAGHAGGVGGRSVPNGVKEAASWSWRILLIGAVVVLLAKAFAAVPIVTIPFVVSLLLTAVLGPVQRWFRDGLRVPHSLAAFLALLVGVVAIGAILAFVAGQITTNAPRMAEQLARVVESTVTWLRDGPLAVTIPNVADYGTQITNILPQYQGQLVSGAISTLSTLSEVLAGGLLLLLSTFFLLRDGDVMWTWALSLMPRDYRRRLDHVGRVGWHTLGGFVRGQTIIAILHASTVFVVLFVMHVPMAVALAVLIFVGSYIPLLGMSVTGTFCIIASLIEHGPAAAVVVAVTIVVLIQLEAHLLQPLIMARTVEVHPLGVAMAVLAGTTLGGIAGALFAVPFVAFVNATARAAHAPLPATTGPVGPVGRARPVPPPESPVTGAPE